MLGHFKLKVRKQEPVNTVEIEAGRGTRRDLEQSEPRKEVQLSLPPLQVGVGAPGVCCALSGAWRI